MMNPNKEKAQVPLTEAQVQEQLAGLQQKTASQMQGMFDQQTQAPQPMTTQQQLEMAKEVLAGEKALIPIVTERYEYHEDLHADLCSLVNLDDAQGKRADVVSWLEDYILREDAQVYPCLMTVIGGLQIKFGDSPIWVLESTDYLQFIGMIHTIVLKSKQEVATFEKSVAKAQATVDTLRTQLNKENLGAVKPAAPMSSTKQ